MIDLALIKINPKNSNQMPAEPIAPLALPPPTRRMNFRLHHLCWYTIAILIPIYVWFKQEAQVPGVKALFALLKRLILLSEVL